MQIKIVSIEAAWQSYRDAVIPRDAPDIQINECRLAFWGGAAVLFSAIINMLDPGAEPTDMDLLRMDAIHQEIVAFGKTFDAEIFKRWGEQRT
ncbi:MAG: hypothetical protein ACREPT_05650 [Rudaea sp.]